MATLQDAADDLVHACSPRPWRFGPAACGAPASWGPVDLSAMDFLYELGKIDARVAPPAWLGTCVARLPAGPDRTPHPARSDGLLGPSADAGRRTLVIPLVIPLVATPHDQAVSAGRRTRPEQQEWHASARRGRSWVDF
jgi:hypothetical protein